MNQETLNAFDNLCKLLKEEALAKGDTSNFEACVDELYSLQSEVERLIP